MMLTKIGSASVDVLRTWRTGGARQVARKGSLRIARKLSDRYAWQDLQFLLRPEDVRDSVTLAAEPPVALRVPSNGRLRVGFVCLPPAGGSGGHTTLFRMIKAVSDAGHDCALFLYDRENEDVAKHRAVLKRHWPWLEVAVHSARPRIDGIDVVVASSWETAHVVASRADPAVPRYYFVQDYEPYFYPRGPLWALAEDSYRFGFKMIALGEMVSWCLQTQVGVVPRSTVPFGCDTDTYHLLSGRGEGSARSGVVVYAKPGADRRGYWLARHALALFHQDHPDQPIHLVGDTVSGWSIPVIQHGSLPPRDLNFLYNESLAGLALSFTNISLVAEEMLAAGAIALVNDSPLARLDLSHPEAVWSPATPSALAAALGRVVDAPNALQRAEAAARNISDPWSETGCQLITVIEEDMTTEAGSSSAT